MSRIASLEAFADKDPFNADLLCDLLDSLLAESKRELAAQRLQAAPSALRVLPGVVFREARIALMEGDLPAVVNLLSPLVRNMSPPPAGLCHDLAFVQFMQGKLEEALETLARAPAGGGENVMLDLLRARIWHRQQRVSDALALLLGVQSAELEAEISGLRALLLLDYGQPEQAAQEAGRALALNPLQFEAGLVQGTLALWQRRDDAAISIFQQLLELQPKAGRAYLGLGESLMLRGDIAAASSMLDRAVAFMPDHVGTWHALAWCQLLQGDTVGAEQSFDRAFALDRTFGETHGGRALIHALRGEREAAGEAIKRALRLDPQGRSARYAQSVLLLDEGNEVEAQAIIRALTQASLRGDIPVTTDFVHTLLSLLRVKRSTARGR